MIYFYHLNQTALKDHNIHFISIFVHHLMEHILMILVKLDLFVPVNLLMQRIVVVAIKKSTIRQEIA